MPVILTRGERNVPISLFKGDDDAAYDYARDNHACVYDDTTMCCVYCRRADH